MKKTVALVVLVLVAAAAIAEGAGGVEFLQVVGQDLWRGPGSQDLPMTTGSITTAGGFGYGGHGTMIGGFGLGVTSGRLGLSDHVLGRPVGAVAGGYGGVLQGWQHTWGPLVGMITTRVGFGGMDWSADSDYTGEQNAGFSMLGGVDGQLGLLVFPWFNVGLVGGFMATLTILPGQPFLITYAPVIGLRLGWGSY